MPFTVSWKLSNIQGIVCALQELTAQKRSLRETRLIQPYGTVHFLNSNKLYGTKIYLRLIKRKKKKILSTYNYTLFSLETPQLNPLMKNSLMKMDNKPNSGFQAFICDLEQVCQTLFDLNVSCEDGDNNITYPVVLLQKNKIK